MTKIGEENARSVRDEMEALFGDFAALEYGVEIILFGALQKIEHSYRDIFDQAVMRTIKAWRQDFSAKCPETLDRFIKEYRADAEEFKFESLHRSRRQEERGRTIEDFKKGMVALHMSGHSDMQILSIMAAEMSEEECSFTTGRSRLLNLYQADLKNTMTLTMIANDEEGARAVYEKIAVTIDDE